MIRPLKRRSAQQRASFAIWMINIILCLMLVAFVLR